MRFLNLKNFILCLSLIVLSGCISSILKEAAPTFSDEINLPLLPTTFNKMRNVTYPSWKNKLTSNVISVLSDCSDSALDLKKAHAMITNAIEGETVLEEKKQNLKNKKSYLRRVKGFVDGLEIEIHSISFKYKNCYYITSLSGLHEKLPSDIEVWSNFNNKIEFKK